MDLTQRLMEAIEDGEVIRVSYAGGSQPGAERDIAPISVKDGKVRARCYASNAVKLFVIDKLSLVKTDSSNSDKWQPGRVTAPHFDSLSDLISAMSEEWERAGWHIESSDEHIGLHMIGKHKKLLKYPTVSISYDPVVHELHMDMDGNFFESDQERVKPWVVSAKNFTTTSFKNFSKAADKFVERSREIIPRR